MRTEAQKRQRKAARMLQKAREYTLGTYCRKFVAPLFQRMIRAEAGAEPEGMTVAIINGSPMDRRRAVGECVCVTCGKVGPWSGGLGGMHTGHFLGSRRHSVLFEEDNVAPQCSSCNRYRNGEPQKFRQWMTFVRGPATVERLEMLKASVRQFTREELVEMRIRYATRLKDAELAMSAG